MATIEYEDDNPLKPMVHIKDSVFQELCAPWQDALVVKLLGKNIGFQTMRDRLTRIWKPQAGFELMDIGSGFYMVKFDMEGDRTKVMEEGGLGWCLIIISQCRHGHRSSYLPLPRLVRQRFG